MAKLSNRQEAEKICPLLERLDGADLTGLNKQEQKELNGIIKILQSFLAKNASKAVKIRNKNPDIINQEDFAYYYYILESTAAFLVDYYTVDCKDNTKAMSYALLGEVLGNAHCLTTLAYMYGAGKYGVIANSKKARGYIERAVYNGGADDVNFELAKEAVLDCEQRAASMRSAALINKAGGSGVFSAFVGFADWFSDYTAQKSEENRLKEAAKQDGAVVLEKTVAGEQYVFYAKDDYGHTKGERLSQYDSLTGKGVTESGKEVTKK